MSAQPEKMSRKELNADFKKAVMLLADAHRDYDNPDLWRYVAKFLGRVDPDFVDEWNGDD